ncbi:MAG: bacillithiol biosynthesis BshC [Acidobacteria bacterium]|nr:bacillithiol biosynthesis BshC [Acidobacteriota bacterium]
MERDRPLVATGQQIGAGWSPALSVVKALSALVLARKLGGEAVYWMADEDHDRLEVASVVGLEAGRLRRHRFHFEAPEGTAAGWLPWTAAHQAEAADLWGALPEAVETTLRGHALALGAPLWRRGLRPFSPTDPAVRAPIQDTLARWRELPLEAALLRQAQRLRNEGAPLPLDPSAQAAWFSLDPDRGRRRRLEPGQPLAQGHWLSPGAVLRPLMQSLLLPVTHAVLGPAERAYWRLAEPLWEAVGLAPPVIVPRPTVYVLPPGARLEAEQVPALRDGLWEAFAPDLPLRPSAALGQPQPLPEWSPALRIRFTAEVARLRQRLLRLDRRLARGQAEASLGMDPERLRQALFPLGKAQERVLPGCLWLRDEVLLDRIARALEGPDPLLLVPGTGP